MLQTASKTYISQTRSLFHCDIKVKIPDTFKAEILDQAFAILEHIDTRYNSYSENSSLDLLNKSAGNFVSLDESAIFILRNVCKISNLTNGAYDITSLPLLKLWGFYSDGRKNVPSNAEISNALTNVDYKKIGILGNQARIGHGQQIVSGSFIKAFAVDMLKSWFRQNGISDAMINAGGSSISAISDVGTNWRVNIPHPAKTDTTLLSLPIENQTFSLSATSNNSIEISGQKFGHILNAKTGKPSSNLQVGVLSASAFLGDAISTALFACKASDFEKTVYRLQQHFDFEAYLIDQNCEVQTTGFAPFKTILP